MEVTHKTRNIRVAPRKLRLLTEKIKHMPATKALEVLPLVNRSASVHVHKSLKAAIEAAKDQNLAADSLIIQRVWCDDGMTMKRVIGHSRGRMSGIMKKHSHLSIVLKGETAAPKARVKAAKTEETSATVEEEK